ncbi:hypothetical protein DFH06DRAFT_335963 [Mycena polygramma]|nr:hypothetical protein DFH06DRAFT_335963 [Mycena polygramma]
MLALKGPECGAVSPKDSALLFVDPPATPGTRHRTLLNSNEPPEESELPFIQSVVSQADARLAGLDEEIAGLNKETASLQGQLKQLKEDRVSVSSYRERNHAILSPLRRLPLEVLGEIFSWTLPLPKEEWGRDKLDLTDSPWVLTHISRHWRAASISTPSLWSKVAIHYRETPDPSSAYPMSVVDAHIRRSQKLKIHFYACETVDSRPQIQMFELLSLHAARWEEFSVAITPALVPLLAHLQGRLPSLRRLWINWEGPESETGVHSIGAYQMAPSLVDLGVYSENCFVLNSLPAHQLTRCELDGPWEIQRGILEQASNLVEAHISIAFDAELQTEDVIDLVHLRRLYVSNSRVLDCLRAPALGGIAIWVDEYNILEIQQLLAFIDRSTCLLRSLCIKGAPDARTTIIVLRRVPSITELSIVLHDLETMMEIDTLMATLTVSPSYPPLAPQPNSLSFGCTDECLLYVEYELYLRMLKSRWETEGCALKRASLATESAAPNPSTLLGLRALQRDGLDLLLLQGMDAWYEMLLWNYATSWN